jgi:hypothetical protein
MVEDLASSVRDIAGSTTQGRVPTVLHHYTSLNCVEKIVNTRSLWATCAADQKDQSELTHGIEFVQAAAIELSRRGVPDFTARVLELLSTSMLARREWTFITCFCGDGRSEYHWETYGQYCLSFPLPPDGRPVLRCSDFGAECWYQQVIYDHASQRRAMTKGVQAIADSIARNTAGVPEGPWTEWLAKYCARNAAQLLLSIAVAFKKANYSREKEWRLVCCPNLALNSSAPDIADHNFAVCIKADPRRHVALRTQSGIQFVEVHQSPLHRNPEDRSKSMRF